MAPEELTLARAIEEEIANRRWTQREASDELGVDQSTVGRWCSGEIIPGVNRYGVLAKFLRLTKFEVAELAFRSHEALPMSRRVADVEHRISALEADVRVLTAQLAEALQARGAER